MATQYYSDLKRFLDVIEEYQTGALSLDDVRAALFVVVGLLTINEERGLFETVRWADVQLDKISRGEPADVQEAREVIDIVATRIRAEMEAREVMDVGAPRIGTESGDLKGRAMTIDSKAKSRSNDTPAFITPPPGAPAYYGFVVRDDITFEGFTLGTITDFNDDPEAGDAFIIAPDGHRAGLVWQVFKDQPGVKQIIPFERNRWGVWSVNLPEPMDSPEAIQRNFRFLVPLLRPRWKEWRREFRRGIRSVFKWLRRE